VQIVALQEIRWKGQGQIKKDKYNLYYNCKECQTGQLGTGFLARKEVVKNIMGFKPINERMCKLRLKGKYHNITIINIHTPTKKKDEEPKEVIYAELQQIQEKVPKHDLLMPIPGKTVRLANMVTQHTKAKIKLNNEYMEQIDVKTGIKQGDPLSTILFSTVMEMLMRKLEIRGNITSLRIRRRCCAGDKN